MPLWTVSRVLPACLARKVGHLCVAMHISLSSGLVRIRNEAYGSHISAPVEPCQGIYISVSGAIIETQAPSNNIVSSSVRGVRSLLFKARCFRRHDVFHSFTWSHASYLLDAARMLLRIPSLLPAILLLIPSAAPTHNLTLTRSAQEIVDLHAKLRDSFPGLKMPTPPIDTASLPAPPKRKSVFLNRLSRFASPSSNKTATSRQVSDRKELPLPPLPPSSNVSSSTASVAQTPLVTPTTEIGDPFAEIGENGEDISALAASNNKVITGLAAYLTTLANDSTMRQARAWKRFVRVRTDDLQSVRVERAIKRVRSDLAAHVSPASATDMQRSISQVVLDGDSSKASSVSEKQSGEEKEGGINGVEKKEEDGVDGTDGEEGGDEGTAEGVEDRAPTPMSPKTPSASVDVAPTPATNGFADDEDDKGPRTPMQTETPACKQRSQSADPSTRTSRLYSSTPSTASQTGDDSSISTTERRSARKKRAKSRDPNSEKKSKRKVVIDDFEMMRVLGKGCAGKVLLVRHKPSQDVYALKAITKRHVLAHQELQHTLTEQAVLKRMAAENTDPFVVKLWWSFHDRENLFLVMVSVI